MKRQRLRIADYRHSPRTPYVLEGYRVNGKRKRIFFRTRAEAEPELARLKIVQRKEGDAGAELGAERRIEAVRCTARLAPWGKTLTDATDFLLAHLEREEKARASLTVEKLVTQRLTMLAHTGRSAVHMQNARTHLCRFALVFGLRTRLAKRGATQILAQLVVEGRATDRERPIRNLRPKTAKHSIQQRKSNGDTDKGLQRFCILKN